MFEHVKYSNQIILLNKNTHKRMENELIKNKSQLFSFITIRKSLKFNSKLKL